MSNCDGNGTSENCDGELKFAMRLRTFPIIYSKSTLPKDIEQKREAWKVLAEEFKMTPEKNKKENSKHGIKNKKSIFYFRYR